MQVARCEPPGDAKARRRPIAYERAAKPPRKDRGDEREPRQAGRASEGDQRKIVTGEPEAALALATMKIECAGERRSIAALERKRSERPFARRIDTEDAGHPRAPATTVRSTMNLEALPATREERLRPHQRSGCRLREIRDVRRTARRSDHEFRACDVA